MLRDPLSTKTMAKVVIGMLLLAASINAQPILYGCKLAGTNCNGNGFCEVNGYCTCNKGYWGENCENNANKTFYEGTMGKTFIAFWVFFWIILNFLIPWLICLMIAYLKNKSCSDNLDHINDCKKAICCCFIKERRLNLIMQASGAPNPNIDSKLLGNDDSKANIANPSENANPAADNKVEEALNNSEKQPLNQVVKAPDTNPIQKKSDAGKPKPTTNPSASTNKNKSGTAPLQGQVQKELADMKKSVDESIAKFNAMNPITLPAQPIPVQQKPKPTEDPTPPPAPQDLDPAQDLIANKILPTALTEGQTKLAVARLTNLIANEAQQVTLAGLTLNRNLFNEQRYQVRTKGFEQRSGLSSKMLAEFNNTMPVGEFPRDKSVKEKLEKGDEKYQIRGTPWPTENRDQSACVANRILEFVQYHPHSRI